MLIIKIIKIKCSNPSRILNEHWCIYSCLQIPPRENWFQYVHRVYETAINFPYITALSWAFHYIFNVYHLTWQPTKYNKNLNKDYIGVYIRTFADYKKKTGIRPLLANKDQKDYYKLWKDEIFQLLPGTT